MEQEKIREILKNIENGKCSADEAFAQLKLQSYEDLGYAKIDHQRGLRQGMGEVIYGAGKTKEQIEGIVTAMLNSGEKSVLITRLTKDSFEYLKNNINARITYDEVSEICVVGKKRITNPHGNIVIATGGTSDIPVAEEAALTAEFYSNKVTRLYDVGVAGVHRLISNADLLLNARVVIAVAGMEGALASVVGGMVDCPVIAVPTSVGYGASFNGLSALLSMLNSCASGVSVVNIDNGFGAGYLASIINKM